MSNTQTKTGNPKKGDQILLVHLEGDAETGIVSAYIRPVQVQSWGKVRGTATHTEGGQFIKSELCTPRETWFRTMDEATDYARQNFAAVGADRIAGALRCEESAFGYLLPQYRAAGAARIARLKTTVPTLVVKVRRDGEWVAQA